MRVTVRLFATLRDRAGLEQIALKLPEPANVSTLLAHMAQAYPSLQSSLPTALVAVNQEYAFPEDTLQEGDEIALFPPVSGGSGASGWPELFAVTPDTLELDAIVTHMTRPETGAICVFAGAVRGVTTRAEHSLNTDHLLYEAYEPMAEQKLHQIASEIRQRYPKVQGIAIVQRIGRLEVGDTTVLVACSAGHRNDGCFEAAQYGINRLKEIVPVWKKEVGRNGSVWVEGDYHPTPEDTRSTSGNANKSRRVENNKSSTAHMTFTFICPECGTQYSPASQHIRCTCGSPLEIDNAPTFDEENIVQQDFSLWRYRAMLAPPQLDPVTLGEGWTPLITSEGFGRDVLVKLESLNPTGAFKDRGASLLISILKAQGIRTVHDDSSGNAGAALAAYAARAGIEARLFVPAAASPRKLAQIRLYGAQLATVTGPRSAAAQAAWQAADNSESFYASHVYNPFSVLAYKSTAYELWEQLGHHVPDVLTMPIGHGTQLLGVAWGFRDLLAAGVADRLPRLIGVQARACAPLWEGFHGGDSSAENMTTQTTLAEGICITAPPRRKRVLDAVRESNGEILCVEESEIREGVQELASRGVIAEPTSATVWPALRQIAPRFPKDATIVLLITGSGHKTPDLQSFARVNMASHNTTT